MAGKERTGRDGIGNDGSGHAKRKGMGAGLYRARVVIADCMGRGLPSAILGRWN